MQDQKDDGLDSIRPRSWAGTVVGVFSIFVTTNARSVVEHSSLGGYTTGFNMSEDPKASILQRVNALFKSVFDDDDLVVTRETTAADIVGWDSLMHVTLLVNVEKAFNMKFTTSEIAALQSVGEMVDLVHGRI